MKRWRSFSVRTIAVTLLLAVSFSQMSITAYDNEFDTGAAADIGGEINTQLLTERNTIKRSSLSYDVRQVAQMETFSGHNSRNIWYIGADNGFHSYNLQTGEDQSVDLGCEISDMARYGNFGM